MSDTPRTDDRVLYAEEIGVTSNSEWVNAPFARGLERELNAANERIKRLEHAGDEMAEWLFSPRNLGGDSCLVHQWNEAKEAKP